MSIQFEPVHWETHTNRDFIKASKQKSSLFADKCIRWFIVRTVSDITGGNYRKSVICLFESFWGIGVILLPLIAYIFPKWQSIYLAISLPTFLYMLVWSWIPDSPSWLLKRGKVESAKRLLLYIVKVNERTTYLPPNFESFLKVETAAQLKKPAQQNWWSLWENRKSTITMIALHLAWAVAVTNYNGMLLNIRAFGRDFLTINTLVAGVCKIIGILLAWLLIIKTNNRKWFYAGLLNIFAGGLSFLGLLLPSSDEELSSGKCCD